MTTSPVLPGGRLRRAYRTVLRDFGKHWFLYLMFLPVLAYYVTFCYRPLYGAQIAFKNFIPARGVQGSPWVGLYHFQSFFSSIYFFRLVRNTVLISLYSLIFGFPAPILLALLMNELRSDKFKRVVQTTTYLPHFISTIVICGMILEFTSSSGVVNTFAALLGGRRVTMLVHPQYFRPVYVISGIWQEVGFGSIIYLAALTG
ncbi:MAG TPA: sugar ABC transporter permease, partial [Clostridia bacterium]|nr:sugar ABC transporter permease [Clostridia bacterium]